MTSTVKSIRLLLILIIMILGSSFVLGEIAVDENFSELIVLNNSEPVYQPNLQFTEDSVQIWTSGDISVISCHYTTYDIFIKNDYAKSINVFINPEISDWITLSDSLVTVAPGKTKKIQAWLRAPCDAEDDYTNKYQFEIKGDRKTFIQELVQSIDVRRSNNLEVYIQNRVAKSDPAEELRYTLVIKNNGPFSETYDVLLEEYMEYFSIAPNTLILRPGDEREVSIYGRMPVDLYGNYTLPLKVEALANGLEAKTNLRADIARYYPFSVEGNETLYVCQDGAGLAYNYSVRNDAKVSNRYDIDIEAPSFVQLGGNYIALESNQTGIIPLFLQPVSTEGFFAQNFIGNHSLALRIESEFGDLVAQKFAKVFVQDCYSVDLQITDAEEKRTVCSGDQPLDITLINTGRYEDLFDLSVTTTLNDELARDITLDQNFIKLGAGENSTLKLNLNTDANISFEKKSFEVTIKAEQRNKSRIYDTLTLSFEKESDKTCYEIEVRPRKVYVVSEENQTETTRLINIENKGIRDSEYELYIENATLSNAQLNESIIYLPSKQSKDLDLYINNTNHTGIESIYVVGKTHDVAFRNPVKIYYNTSDNWLLWVIGILSLILLLLLIFLLIALLGKKDTSKKKSYEEPVRKERSQKVKPIREYSEKIKEKEKKSYVWIWWILLLLLLVLLLIGGIWLIYSSFVPAEDVGNETITGMNETVVNETSSNQTTIWSRIKDVFLNTFLGRNETVQPNATTNETVVNGTIIFDGENETDINTTPINQSEFNQTETGSESLLERIISSLSSLFSVNQTGNRTNETIFNQTQSNATDVNQTDIDECEDVEEMLQFIQDNNLSTSFEYQRIPYNAVIEINLSEVFIDPDGDILNFSSDNVSNITITHTDDLVIIEPQKGFCGVRTTRFYAEDSSGANASSPEIHLIVLPEDNWKESLQVLVIAILVLIILFALLYRLLLHKD